MITTKLSSKGVLSVIYGSTDNFSLDVFYTGIVLKIVGGEHNGKVIGYYEQSKIKRINLQEKNNNPRHNK